MTGYKKISTKTKRRNKRDSANICMSQFWCTVTNKPPKSSHVYEMCGPLFLHLPSLPDFSTYLRDFAEALFAY